MAHKNFRDFLSMLQDEKELLTVPEEVPPEPDVGAMGRATCDMEMNGRGPAILCENVCGYKIPLPRWLMLTTADEDFEKIPGRFSKRSRYSFLNFLYMASMKPSRSNSATIELSIKSSGLADPL